MKTVEIVEPFTGYPEGRQRAFAAGETLSVPDDVPAELRPAHRRQEACALGPSPRQAGEGLVTLRSQ